MLLQIKDIDARVEQYCSESHLIRLPLNGQTGPSWYTCIIMPACTGVRCLLTSFAEQSDECHQDEHIVVKWTNTFRKRDRRRASPLHRLCMFPYMHIETTKCPNHCRNETTKLSSCICKCLELSRAQPQGLGRCDAQDQNRRLQSMRLA